MVDSILNSVKLAVNLTPDNPEFDSIIVMYINSAFATLSQIGVGPVKGFRIDDATTTWDDFLKGDDRFNSAKDYISMKVRLAFDPPGTSFHLSAMQEALKELEFRLNVAREYTIYGLPVSAGSGSGELPGNLDGGNAGPVSVMIYDGGGATGSDNNPVYDGGGANG